MEQSFDRLLANAKQILVFTGAGVSTASGVPDFRGPQGVWKRRQPVYFNEFLTSHEKRVEYWDYKLEGWPTFAAARPNRAHHAIVALEERGVVHSIVTQNIDGLHQAAGSAESRVIELHGTNRFIECVRCGAWSAPEPHLDEYGRTGQPPLCECGGFLKFATISFGQSLDSAVLERAFSAARRCDLVVALGSTLSVQPAASVPLEAAKRGVPYVVVNRGATDHDDIATLRLEGDVSTLFPDAVDQLAR